MRLLPFILLFSILLAYSPANAQPAPNQARQPRILILLDGSSSMLNPWNGGGENRFRAARSLILNLMDSIYAVNDQVEFALRVFGHQSPVQANNCFDTRREVNFSRRNEEQMGLRLDDLRPAGITPIAFSLKEAAELDLYDPQHHAYSIILITDGGESCNGDICKTVESLINSKIFFKPYILSMVDYAPLRDVYRCLGTYLQVSKPAEVGPAIHNIVEAYRPMLVMPVMRARPMPVAQAPARDTRPVIIAPAPRPTPPAPRDTTPSPAQQPVARQEPPVQPARPLDTVISMRSSSVSLPKMEVVTLPMRRHNFSMPLRFGTPSFRLFPIPKVTFPRPEPVAATPPPRPAATKPPPPPKPKETAFTKETEDAQETLVEVYFTDGRGTFYQSMPQIQLTDPQSGRQISKFFRTTGPNGNPDPQKIPAGTYNLSLLGRSNIVMRNVVVEENKRNKIIVKVSSGTLSFAYTGAPDRPVSEYDAIVTRRFEPGPTIKQRCSSVLEYKPGNYYIEVNTLPISRFNTDVDFGSITEIRIPQPGNLHITNTNRVGRVWLYYQLGDKFARFYGMDVTGNPASQKLTLLPGPYEAHFIKDPNVPYPKETVIKFRVNSNETTELEIE